jgi:hypothetical protein
MPSEESIACKRCRGAIYCALLHTGAVRGRDESRPYGSQIICVVKAALVHSAVGWVEASDAETHRFTRMRLPSKGGEEKKALGIVSLHPSYEDWEV